MTDQAASQSADRLLGVIHEVARELQSGREVPRPELESDLERDLGLDSLARIELMLRLERHFGIRLSDETAIEARTPRDLLTALGDAPPVDAEAAPATMDQRSEAGAGSDAGPPRAAGTLIEVLDWHADQRPDKVCVTLHDDAGHGERLTYGELRRGAAQVATGLRERGLRAGQTVAIMLPSGFDYFFAFHGILRAGGIPVPIYPPLRPDQIESHCRRQAGVLGNAGSVFLIASLETRAVGRLLRGLLPDLQDVVSVDDLRAEGGVTGSVPRSSRDIAFLQYTSGTTGNPKGVVLTHANLLANIRAMEESIQPDAASDVFVSWLPLYHDMGLIGACLGTLYYGVHLVLMSPLQFIARPQRWLWAIHRHGGTLSAGPNFAYDLCAGRIDDEALRGLDLSSWRLAFNGAEPVVPRTLRRFEERFRPYGFRPEAMSPVYGLAESSVGLAFSDVSRPARVDRVQRATFHSEGRAIPAGRDEDDALEFVDCGQPLPGHEIRIVDEQDRELPERHQGHLQFRGPSCTSGYYRNAEATAGLFHGDWLDSGDYAYLVDGAVYPCGRSKDMIIRAGRNIYPYDLEQAISQIEGIRKNCVAVFSSPEPETSLERLVVMAETRETDGDVRERLRDRIRDTTLELLEIPPDDVALVPPQTVPKTSSGKIRRPGARAIYEQGVASARGGAMALQVVRLVLSGTGPALARGLRHVRNGLFTGWSWLVSTVLLVPALLVLAVLPGARARAGLARWTTRAAFAGAGIPLRVQGRDNLPQGPCIYVANHASYIDSPALRAVLPGPFVFVGKRELHTHPVSRLMVKRLGGEYVERADHRQGLADLERTEKRARGGESVLFFAEGTFTSAEGLRPFRIGAFMVAVRAGLPVVPIALRGTRSILRGHSYRPLPGRIDIDIGPPIHPTGDDWDAALRLRDETRAFILEHCGETDLESTRTGILGDAEGGAGL